jgi:hypothetical protein
MCTKTGGDHHKLGRRQKYCILFWTKNEFNQIAEAQRSYRSKIQTSHGPEDELALGCQPSESGCQPLEDGPGVAWPEDGIGWTEAGRAPAGMVIGWRLYAWPIHDALPGNAGCCFCASTNCGVVWLNATSTSRIKLPYAFLPHISRYSCWNETTMLTGGKLYLQEEACGQQGVGCSRDFLRGEEPRR